MLIKSNRTALQTYKVEKRTFGTPCILFHLVVRISHIITIIIIIIIFSSFTVCTVQGSKKQPVSLGAAGGSHYLIGRQHFSESFGCAQKG